MMVGPGGSPREAWSEGRRGSVSGVSCRERCPEGVPVKAAIGVGLLGASWEPSAEAAALRGCGPSPAHVCGHAKRAGGESPWAGLSGEARSSSGCLGLLPFRAPRLCERACPCRRVMSMCVVGLLEFCSMEVSPSQQQC